MLVGLELWIHTVEPCGSDNLQIGLYEECITFDRSITILLIGSESTWTMSWSSHLGTLGANLDRYLTCHKLPFF